MLRIWVQVKNFYLKDERMGIKARFIGIIGTLLLSNIPLLKADQANIKVKVQDIDASEDTHFIIKKVSLSEKNERPDFEMITESEEIVGNPSLQLQEAKENWEEACENWKRSVRKQNKKHDIPILKCGTPKEIKEAHGQRSFHSEGTFSVRMHTKYVEKKSEENNIQNPKESSEENQIKRLKEPSDSIEASPIPTSLPIPVLTPTPQPTPTPTKEVG